MSEKIKITDVIIGLLVIIIAIVGLFVFFKKKNFSNLPVEKEATIAFDVFFRGVTLTAPEIPFKQGEDAFITIRNIPYTKLEILYTDGRPRMITLPATDKNGYTAVPDASSPNLFDFVVTLKDKAKKTPDGYVAGGNKIKMGIPVVIEGEKYKYSGTVSNVYEIEIPQEEVKDTPSVIQQEADQEINKQ